MSRINVNTLNGAIGPFHLQFKGSWTAGQAFAFLAFFFVVNIGLQVFMLVLLSGLIVTGLTYGFTHLGVFLGLLLVFWFAASFKGMSK